MRCFCNRNHSGLESLSKPVEATMSVRMLQNTAPSPTNRLPIPSARWSPISGHMEIHLKEKLELFCAVYSDSFDPDNRNKQNSQ